MSNIMSNVNQLLERAAGLLLPELENPEDPGSLDKDFSGHAKRAAQFLTELNEAFLQNGDLLKSILSDTSSWSKLVLVVLVCGEHSCPNPWASNDSVKAAESVLQTLNSNFNQGRKQKFIIKISSMVFETLRPKLRKETFAANPAAVSVFTWLLFQHKHPDLSDVLHLVIPTALILVDDFRQENRVTGLRCLHHVIRESDPAELLRYGRAELFLDALKPLQYQQDPNLVEALYPALVTCLTVLHPHPEDASTWLSISPWDESVSILLNNLNLVQNDDQKLRYLSVLDNVLSRVQARFTRFLTPTLNILEEFLEVHGGNEELHLKSLQVLESIIHHCWPSIVNHPDTFWLLIKFIHDIIKTKPDSWDRLKLPVKCCVSKLDKPVKSLIDRFCNDLKAQEDELEEPLCEAFNFVFLN